MKIAKSSVPTPPSTPAVASPKAKHAGLTDEQRAAAKQGSISESRFESSFWRNDNHGNGARPPDKIIWDSWSPQQRAEAGLPNFSDWKAAAVSWRNEVTQNRAQKDIEIYEAAQKGGFDINTEKGFKQALNAAGIFDRPDEGQAGFRRRMGQFKGDIDPTGRYHFTGDGKVIDVATSDLGKRGIPMAPPPGVERLTGPRAALRGVYATIDTLGKWASQNLAKVGPNAEAKVLRDGLGFYVNEGRNRIRLDDLGRYQDGSNRVYGDVHNMHDVLTQAAGRVRFGGGGPHLE